MKSYLAFEKPYIFQAATDEDGEELCTSDKTIIEKLLNNYKSFRTPSESGVIVWIEVGFFQKLVAVFMTFFQVTKRLKFFALDDGEQFQ